MAPLSALCLFRAMLNAGGRDGAIVTLFLLWLVLMRHIDEKYKREYREVALKKRNGMLMLLPSQHEIVAETGSQEEVGRHGAEQLAGGGGHCAGR